MHHSRIGQATALAFAKHGITRLALADVNPDALTASIAALEESCPQVEEVLPLRMDVRKSGEIKEGVARAAAKFGRIDIARVIDINLNGAYRCHKEEIGVMVGQEDLGFRQGRGVIINVASVYGLVGPQNPIHQSAYAAAKHGVLGLTKAEANSYASDNIRINAICSGYVTTPLIMDHLAADPQSPVHQQVDLTPMKRMATAEEVAENIVFLASPMSSFMHGAAIVVDGGFTSF
ncbi:Levodione reductase [Tolypocladium ophioglossoides CBS 100239]|uniref:Levodione reductase n=1 Tax=Tolypocladium ophioglossoides (strain CBS 100239) TaxID=1163406 RepID=A0A0L0NHV9_TOLOC|nr:Levodione reductase [Tolypocladium ophioglossoides CBS 100239]